MTSDKCIQLHNCNTPAVKCEIFLSSQKDSPIPLGPIQLCAGAGHVVYRSQFCLSDSYLVLKGDLGK